MSHHDHDKDDAVVTRTWTRTLVSTAVANPRKVINRLLEIKLIIYSLHLCTSAQPKTEWHNRADVDWCKNKYVNILYINQWLAVTSGEEQFCCMHCSFALLRPGRMCAVHFETKIHFIIAQTAPQVNQSQLSFVRNFTVPLCREPCFATNIRRPLCLRMTITNLLPSSVLCIQDSIINGDERERCVGAATTEHSPLHWDDTTVI